MYVVILAGMVKRHDRVAEDPGLQTVFMLLIQIMPQQGATPFQSIPIDGHGAAGRNSQ